MSGASSAARDTQDDAGLAMDLAKLYVTIPPLDNVGQEGKEPENEATPTDSGRMLGRLSHLEEEENPKNRSGRIPLAEDECSPTAPLPAGRAATLSPNGSPRDIR
eukprot:GHVS01014550.1.p2 GENE.GHVS01014550.1~~GHVS01014550.1.p2  ORF type:complete len:105 (+),score=11.36 GHVS01014550.1:177-491(+)